MTSREPHKLIPEDVREWLSETYSDHGVDIWLVAWANADPAHRERMVRIARAASGGT